MVSLASDVARELIPKVRILFEERSLYVRTE